MAGWKTLPDLKYAKTDEWLRLEGSSAEVGLSDYAQDALNDIVFVELPKVGAAVTAGEAFGVVESVKAASDLTAPVSGTVSAVNAALESSPEQINADPYGAWIIKIAVTDASAAADLMDAAAYDEYCTTR
ncbi:MAG: glycine cleavage system protein GcvH [Anaerolineae bacterium]|nr:glycine cleavage system protein GcvH [Anaerolineae bacterium]